MNHAAQRLAALILALSVLAAAFVAGSAVAMPRQADAAQGLQRLLGGLGFGPAIDLTSCEAAFDPRLCPHCSNDLAPIPAGKVFCPHHAGALPAAPPFEMDP
jgi:hypothetical protein